MSSSLGAPVNVRTARADDAEVIFSLIQALADYEKLAHEVVGSAAAIAKHSTGDTDDVQASQRPCITTLLAEVNQTPVGLALFFQTYSTQAAAPGYYLEDLFVLPDYRQKGVGKALLRALAQHALSHNVRQLRWSVLDWNELAIAFYRRIGAEISEDCRICRVSGEALGALGSSADSTSVSYRVVLPSEVSEVVSRLKGWGDELAEDSADDSADHAADNTADNADGKHADRPPWTLVEALVAHGSAQVPPFELLQVSQGDELLGVALFTHSYSTFLTQPGVLVEAIAINPHRSHDVAEREVCRALAQLTLERQGGRLEWYTKAHETAAIARYQQWGATVLPNWRICRLDAGAIAKLAQA
ncbi:MAG: GNAT family N-acetyltransferase [Elainellaceae cyanobacterium]